MNIIILLIFISLILVALALVLYVFSVRNHDLDHTDQLSLMPLEEEGHQASIKNKGDFHDTDGIPGSLKPETDYL